MFNIGTIFILIIFNFLLVINYSRISKIINIYDIPDFKRKIHKHKTPLLGGLIFFLNIIVYLFLLAIDFISIENIFFKNEYELIFFISIGFILFFIGLYDDKKNLTPNIKLFLFFICLISLMFLNDEILPDGFAVLTASGFVVLTESGFAALTEAGFVMIVSSLSSAFLFIIIYFFKGVNFFPAIATAFPFLVLALLCVR